MQVPHTPCSHDTGTCTPAAASAATTLWSAATRISAPDEASCTSKAPSPPVLVAGPAKYSRCKVDSGQPAGRAAESTVSMKPAGPQTYSCAPGRGCMISAGMSSFWAAGPSSWRKRTRGAKLAARRRCVNAVRSAERVQ